MTRCAVDAAIVDLGGVEWRLDGVSSDMATEATVIEPSPPVWIPIGHQVCVVAGEAGGQALFDLPPGGLPHVALLAARTPSECCKSRLVLRLEGATAGCAGYVHYGLPDPEDNALARFGEARLALGPGEDAKGFVVGPLVAAGMFLNEGMASVLWAGVDGYPHGFEGASTLPPGGGRRVAERFQDIDGVRLYQSFLGLADGRFIGFSPTPTGAGAMRKALAPSLRAV